MERESPHVVSWTCYSLCSVDSVLTPRPAVLSPFAPRGHVLTSGGASIEGARAPPLLKCGDEKKKRRKKYNISCQKTLYTKSFK